MQYICLVLHSCSSKHKTQPIWQKKWPEIIPTLTPSSLGAGYSGSKYNGCRMFPSSLVGQPESILRPPLISATALFPLEWFVFPRASAPSLKSGIAPTSVVIGVIAIGLGVSWPIPVQQFWKFLGDFKCYPTAIFPHVLFQETDNQYLLTY